MNYTKEKLDSINWDSLNVYFYRKIPLREKGNPRMGIHICHIFIGQSDVGKQRQEEMDIKLARPPISCESSLAYENPLGIALCRYFSQTPKCIIRCAHSRWAATLPAQGSRAPDLIKSPVCTEEVSRIRSWLLAPDPNTATPNHIPRTPIYITFLP